MITSDQVDSASVCPLCGTSSHTNESCSWTCTLFRCSKCGLVHTWPLAESQSLYEEAYTENGGYNSYLHLAKEANQGEQQLMWAMRCFLKSATVTGTLLDVGCSVGSFMQAAQQRGWLVAGVEISAKAGNIAITLTGAPVHVGTITDFSVASKFDVLTAWEVLEHIAKPLEFMQSVTALLKNGGTLAISVPNWESPWMQRSLLAEHWPPTTLHTGAEILSTACSMRLD